MKDIKIIFKGDNSYIDLENAVEDKNLGEQKGLINIVTERGSDPLYEDRGTSLLNDSIHGKIFSYTGTIHAGNFAALDTIYFNSEHEYSDEEEPIANASRVKDINITTISYNNSENLLNLSVQFIFADDTATQVIADLSGVR